MRGVHHNLHGHKCPPMLPPTPRYSNKLIRLLILPRPTLSLDKLLLHCFVPWALLSQACKPHPIATLHPKRKGLRYRRLSRWHVCHLCHDSTDSRRRGPPHFRCEANRENRLHFAWNPPAIRSMKQPPAGNHTAETRQHALPQLGMVLVTPCGEAFKRRTSTKN